MIGGMLIGYAPSAVPVERCTFSLTTLCTIRWFCSPTCFHARVGVSMCA
jgi:hypothetical protein